MSGMCWEVAQGKTLHLIPPDQPRRRSGARALCGRYAQGREHPWFSLMEDEMPRVPPYGLIRCADCVEASR